MFTAIDIHGLSLGDMSMMAGTAYWTGPPTFESVLWIIKKFLSTLPFLEVAKKVQMCSTWCHFRRAFQVPCLRMLFNQSYLHLIARSVICTFKSGRHGQAQGRDIRLCVPALLASPHDFGSHGRSGHRYKSRFQRAVEPSVAITSQSTAGLCLR